jgi:hypothetical protein
MEQTVEGPEIWRQARSFSYSVNRAPYFGSLLPTTARENIGGIGVSTMILQQFSGRLIQGHGLVFAALGLPDMDKTLVKINIIPFQLE